MRYRFEEQSCRASAEPLWLRESSLKTACQAKRRAWQGCRSNPNKKFVLHPIAIQLV
jgi:hypothetical protein